MRIKFLILALLTVAILIAPAAAYFPFTNGTFGGTTEAQQLYRNWSRMNSGGMESIKGIFFQEIENFNEFKALKIYTTPDAATYFDRLNTTSNFTYTDATLTDGFGTTISTGTFGYAWSSTTGEWYIYYFANTWDLSGLTGPQFLNMTYNLSEFNIRFDQFTNANPVSLTTDLDVGFGSTTDYLGFDKIAVTHESWEHYYTIEYEDFLRNDWELYKDDPEDLYYNVGIKRIFGVYAVNSRIRLSATINGSYSIVYDDEDIIDFNITGLHPNNFPMLLEYWSQDGANYEYAELELEGAGEEEEGTDLLWVNVYDGLTGDLYSGATVYLRKADLTPIRYSYSTSGVVYLWVDRGHTYNLSATAVGMSTDYLTKWIPYSPTESDLTVDMYIYPEGGAVVGYGLANFVTYNSDGQRLRGVSIHTDDGQYKTTGAGGDAQFNVTAGYHLFGTYLENYRSINGNFTVASGDTELIELTIYSLQENPEGGPTPTLSRSQHIASAEDVWYNNLEFLSALIFLAVIIGTMKKMKP